MNKPVLRVIPNTSTTESIGQVLRIPLDLIRLYEDQPRKTFLESRLESLSQSIRAIGQKSPGIVRLIDKGAEPDSPHDYELVDGERRFRACKIAGINSFLATVSDIEDEHEQLLEAGVLNMHSEEHTIMEKSNMVASLMRFYDVPTICAAFGKSDAWVYQYKSLQKLSPKLQKLTEPNISRDEKLVASLANVIVRIDDHKVQEEIFSEVMELLPKKRKGAALRRVESLVGKPRGNRHGGANNKRVEKIRTTRGARFIYDFADDLPRDLERINSLSPRDFVNFIQSRSKGEAESIISKLEAAHKELGILVNGLKATRKTKRSW